MEFIRILGKFIPKYKWRIVVYIILNIVCSICSVFSFAAIVPLLNILFGISDKGIEKLSGDNISSWADFLDYEKNNILYYLQEQISIKGPAWTLVEICLFFVFMTLLFDVISLLAYWVRIPIRTGISRDLRKDAYSKITRMSLHSFTKENKGDFVSRMTSDVEEIDFGIGTTLDMFIKDPVQIIVYIVTMFGISAMLTWYALGLLLITSIIVFIIGKRMKTISLVAQAQRGQILSTFEQTIGALRIVKAFNAEERLEKRFSKLNNSARNTFNHQNMHYSYAWPSTDFLIVLSIGTMLCIGGTAILAGKSNITASELMCFLVVFCSVNSPMRDMMKCTFGIRKAMASAQRYNKILSMEDDAHSDYSKKVEKAKSHSLTYDNVDFAYDEKPVLTKTSFCIKSGEHIALVGATGSGKTSIVNLLLKFHEVNKGNIYIDDINIKDIQTKEVRNSISYVGQECILFNDTIFNNIAFAIDDANESDVIEAAKGAHIHDFIMSLPEKYNTMVGDNGLSLSGGQRQCICLARAFLKNSSIYILDESTSALDQSLEEKIIKTIERVCADKTLIFITHKLPASMHFDNIYTVEDGSVIKS